MTVLLHLGDMYFVRMEDVISIHDYKAFNDNDRNALFWKTVEGRVEDISMGRKMSVVITMKRVYISAISAKTLRKRAEETPKSLILTEVLLCRERRKQLPWKPKIF